MREPQNPEAVHVSTSHTRIIRFSSELTFNAMQAMLASVDGACAAYCIRLDLVVQVHKVYVPFPSVKGAGMRMRGCRPTPTLTTVDSKWTVQPGEHKIIRIC